MGEETAKQVLKTNQSVRRLVSLNISDKCAILYQKNKKTRENPPKIGFFGGFSLVFQKKLLQLQMITQSEFPLSQHFWKSFSFFL